MFHQDKLMKTLMVAVVFAIFNHPEVYKIVNGLLKSFVKISEPNGCPTLIGLVVHNLLASVIVNYLL